MTYRRVTQPGKDRTGMPATSVHLQAGCPSPHKPSCGIPISTHAESLGMGASFEVLSLRIICRRSRAVMKAGNVFEAQPQEEGGHSPNTNLVNAVVCVPCSSWALRGVLSPLWMPISSSEKHIALYHTHFPSSPDGRWFYLSSGA